ncbi:MAG: polyhydroxyalkanoate synthesis repressor PhaR [Pseudomonadota bacterium]
MAKRTASDGPVIIKKYANRRLYNTETSSYVTLDFLAQMVKDERDFQVVDAKSGQDLTRSVLTQIIVDEESKGETLLPLSFLRQLIAFYGGGMDTLVPHYLEQSMAAFAAQQDKWRQMMTGGMGANPGLSALEDLTRNNLAMFDQATKMWTGGMGQAEQPSEEAGNEMATMRAQMAAMQRQLDKLAGKS